MRPLPCREVPVKHAYPQTAPQVRKRTTYAQYDLTIPLGVIEMDDFRFLNQQLRHAEDDRNVLASSLMPSRDLTLQVLARESHG